MYIFIFIYYFPIKPRIRFLLKMYFWWYNNIRPKSSNLLFCDKKKSKTLGRVLNWLNKCMYLIITFRFPQVRVASVTVQINEVLSCTKRHAWKMKYPCIRLSALIYTQLRRKKIKIFKPNQETQNGYLATISEKDWTLLATYHGDHLSQTPFP